MLPSDVWTYGPDRPIAYHGSIQGCLKAKRTGMVPGPFFDHNAFKVSEYAHAFGDDLLNQPQFMTVGQYLRSNHGDRFVRPDSSLKPFGGQVSGPGLNSDLRLLRKSEFIATSKLVDIRSEHRALVRDGQVIAASTYMVDGEITYGDDVPYEVREYMREHATVQWGNTDAMHVLDVAVTKDGRIKVLEVNCASSSGVYNQDPASLDSMIHHFEDEAVKVWKDLTGA